MLRTVTARAARAVPSLHPRRACPRAFATAADPPSVKPTPHEGVPFAAIPIPVPGAPVGFVPVQLPDMSEGVIVEHLRIPSEPDNYSLSPNPAEAFPSFVAPRVETVAAPSTHLDGGPVHALTSDDVIPGERGDSLASLPKDAVAPPHPDEHDAFAYEDRPLTADERRGAYSLLAILLAGWLLAGLGSPSKPKKKKAAASPAH